MAIVGGGLAGIAAATALGQAGFPVTLLEARPSLGGRATSYTDAESGLVIDNCQHVSMGCCTNLKHLCRSLQIDKAFQTEQVLYFIGPDGRCSSFRADPLPAPLHLARAFWRLPYLSFFEKRAFAHGIQKLAAAKPASLRGISFQNWLVEHDQPVNVIRRAWEVVLVSALSESLDRIDAGYARMVFMDGFLNNASGWKVEIPQVSLDELYSTQTAQALRALGVDIQLQARGTALISDVQQVRALVLKNGREIQAEEWILAVPHHQLPALVATLPGLQPLADQIHRLETAPITSVHLWFDRVITSLPHAVLVERLGQWLFSRGKSRTPAGEGELYQVVISASRHLGELTQEQVVDQIVAELGEIWPAAREARLLHSRLITERRAVFSALPGVDRDRPPQQTAIPNLQLAGDWTRTGWPATMEGAVRSGYLAAGNLMKRYGIHDLSVQPPLPRSWLARRLWKADDPVLE